MVSAVLFSYMCSTRICWNLGATSCKVASALMLISARLLVLCRVTKLARSLWTLEAVVTEQISYRQDAGCYYYAFKCALYMGQTERMLDVIIMLLLLRIYYYNYYAPYMWVRHAQSQKR